MLPDLKIAKVKFSFEVEDTINLPRFIGSSLRGGFGKVFKQVVCAQKGVECRDCMLKANCSYSVIFETPNLTNEEKFAKNENLPKPFIFSIPEEKTEYKDGEILTLDLSLIGWAVQYFPYFFIVLQELGRIGFGLRGESGERGKYKLSEVRQEKSFGEEVLFNSSLNKKMKSIEGENIEEFSGINKKNLANLERVRVEFLSPLRIKYQKKLCDEITFEILMRNILRRLSMFYLLDKGETLDWDFKSLVEKAKGIELEKSFFRWEEYGRFSTRQKQKIRLGGVMGEATYKGEDLSRFFPLLKAGELLHVGKGTTFGFGQIKVSRREG